MTSKKRFGVPTKRQVQVEEVTDTDEPEGHSLGVGRFILWTLSGCAIFVLLVVVGALVADIVGAVLLPLLGIAATTRVLA